MQYGSRRPVRSKLDTYKAIIDARLAEYPKLTATRLFREVLKAGCPGGYGQVNRYVRQVRPRVVQKLVQRFETPPGTKAK